MKVGGSFFGIGYEPENFGGYYDGKDLTFDVNGRDGGRFSVCG
jgi:hypothetical protein